MVVEEKAQQSERQVKICNDIQVVPKSDRPVKNRKPDINVGQKENTEIKLDNPLDPKDEFEVTYPGLSDFIDLDPDDATPEPEFLTTLYESLDEGIDDDSG